MLGYRAGRLLDPWLDLERGCTDVLEAEVMDGRSGDDAEHADSSGFWWLLEFELRSHHLPGVFDLQIPIEKLLLTKVLQPLWFNEGESAACGAITDGATFVRGTGMTGAQTQLLSGWERERQMFNFPLTRHFRLE